MVHAFDFTVLGILLLYALPILVALLRFRRTGGVDWREADRGSAGLLPGAGDGVARVRVLSARTVSWRGAVASHCWIVLKRAGARRYARFDYIAWGAPVRQDMFAPDARWFGAAPEVLYAADGAAAAALIPAMEEAIRTYRWARHGDYRAVPGPNSNSFVQAVIDAVPGLDASLPPTAIGKDFPHDGRWWRLARKGVHLTWRGWLGVRLGWVDGLEVNLFGAVAGLDWRRPALKLPAIGRVGMRLSRD